MTFESLIQRFPALGNLMDSAQFRGFGYGIAFSAAVLILCWILRLIFRLQSTSQMIRVVQADGSLLLLTGKAIRSHVQLIFTRDFPLLTLQKMEMTGKECKKMMLTIAVTEGLNVSDWQLALCERLKRSFVEDLGLKDKIEEITVLVEKFTSSKVPLSAKDTSAPLPEIHIDVPKDESSVVEGETP